MSMKSPKPEEHHSESRPRGTRSARNRNWPRCECETALCGAKAGLYTSKLMVIEELVDHIVILVQVQFGLFLLDEGPPGLY